MINIILLIVPIAAIIVIWDIGLSQFSSGVLLIEALVIQIIIGAVAAVFGCWHINNRK